MQGHQKNCRVKHRTTNRRARGKGAGATTKDPDEVPSDSQALVSQERRDLVVEFINSPFTNFRAFLESKKAERVDQP